jgi:hypothetical protein
MDEIRNLKVNSIDDFSNNQSSKIIILESYTDTDGVVINIRLPIEILECNYEIFGIADFYMNGLLTNNYGIEHLISFIASPKHKYFIKLKLTETNDEGIGNVKHSMYYGIYTVEEKKEKKMARNISINIKKERLSSPNENSTNMYGVLLSSEEESDEGELGEVDFAHNSINYRISSDTDILSSLYADSRYSRNMDTLSEVEKNTDDTSDRREEHHAEYHSLEEVEEEVLEEVEVEEEMDADSEEEIPETVTEEEDANILLLELLNSTVNSLETVAISSKSLLTTLT